MINDRLLSAGAVTDDRRSRLLISVLSILGKRLVDIILPFPERRETQTVSRTQASIRPIFVTTEI